jgi:hypothetical protein
MKLASTILFILLLVSCKHLPAPKELSRQELAKFDFQDSTFFSIPGQRNLIAIKKYVSHDSCTFFVNVYSAIDTGGKWEISQQFDSLKLTNDWFKREFKDYNGDGIEDLALITSKFNYDYPGFVRLFFWNQDKRKLIMAKGVNQLINPTYDARNDLLSTGTLSDTLLMIEYKILNCDSLIKYAELNMWMEKGEPVSQKIIYDLNGNQFPEKKIIYNGKQEYCYFPGN